MRLARWAGIRPAAADTTVKQQHRPGRDPRIVRLDAVQLRRHEAAERDRRRNADGETDRQQQQHLPHHEPDHEPRLRAEREPDAELLLPPRDDKRHHAVETDRGQQRREQAEARREQRDQPVGQQRLVELRLRASSSRRPASTNRAASPRFGSAL